MYQVGETFKISISVVDTDGSAVDPTSVLIHIREPDGTVIDGVAMTSTATGEYHHYITIGSKVGKHFIKIVAAGAAGNVIHTSTYDVVESFS